MGIYCFRQGLLIMHRLDYRRDRTKVIGLIAIMSVLVLVATALSTLVLYRTAFREQKDWLHETNHSRARLIEVMYSHELEQRQANTLPEDGTAAAVLGQLLRVLPKMVGLGASGEFVLARPRNGRIDYLLPLRHSLPGQIPSIPLQSPLAAPMQRALAGEAGVMVGHDYRGVEVLAAYQPISGLGWGLVTKVDLAEIRKPFLRSGLLVGSVGCGLALVGGLLIGRTSNRLVHRIREGERRLQTLMDNLPGMAYRRANDRHWTMEMVSRGGLELTGLTPAELAGSNDRAFNDFIHPEDRLRIRTEIQAAVAAQRPFTLEYRLVTTDGQVKQVWEQGRAVPEEDGQPSSLEGFIMDVTASREATAALAASEARFRTLFESMQEGVALHELLPEGDGQPTDYRILDVNPAFERILGIPREAAVGSRASDLYPGEAPPYVDIYGQVARGGKATTFETYFPAFAKHFQISVFSPEPGRFATVFEDISLRKEAMNALHESEEQLRRAVINAPPPGDDPRRGWRNPHAQPDLDGHYRLCAGRASHRGGVDRPGLRRPGRAHSPCHHQPLRPQRTCP